MNLLIRLVRDRPPTGDVRVIGDPGSSDGTAVSVSFSGWLGLIRILEELVDEHRAGAGR